MTVQDLIVPTYVQMLRGLLAWLDKAQAELAEDAAEALLAERLAPDMFPLSSQIRLSCLQAVEGMSRLQGKAYPPLAEQLLAEARGGGDNAGSMGDAAARISETLAFVEQAAAQGTMLDDDAAIAHDLPMGLVFDVTAQQFARDWTLPQLYFHITTAYAILRSKGITLGKQDFVGHMFAYLRPSSPASS